MISCIPRMRALLIVAVLPLAACNETTLPAPPDHSVNYTKIPVVSSKGRLHKVTVAEACLRTDENDPRLLGGELPPGCANAHNLQLMAEQEKDLYHGRRMGAAPAAPSVRAAQKYIRGGEKALAGGVIEPGEGGGDGNAPASAATPAE